MTALDVIRRLHQHRAWANARLLTAAAELDDEALRRKLAIGQGSVWKSLVHMYAAEWVWLATLKGDESPLFPGDLPGKLPGNQEGPRAIASLAELKEKWLANEAGWRDYLEALAEPDLDALVPKVSSSGQRAMTRRGDILLHVCTHAHYTTAQVINMLRQLGVTSLPDPMLITLARAELAEATKSD